MVPGNGKILLLLAALNEKNTTPESAICLIMEITFVKNKKNRIC